MTKARFQTATSDHDRRHAAAASFDPRHAALSHPRSRVVTFDALAVAFASGALLACLAVLIASVAM